MKRKQGKKNAIAFMNLHGKWYIKTGFPGFNSRTNNGMGYATKEKAESASARYASK